MNDSKWKKTLLLVTICCIFFVLKLYYMYQGISWMPLRVFNIDEFESIKSSLIAFERKFDKDEDSTSSAPGIGNNNSRVHVGISEDEGKTLKNNQNNEIFMDKYEKEIFDNGKDIDGYKAFYNVSEFYSIISPGDVYYRKRDLSNCSNIKLIFPHVPKTGGRSLSFTFNDEPRAWGADFGTAQKFVNHKIQRSKLKMSFATTRAHHDVVDLFDKNINTYFKEEVEVKEDMRDFYKKYCQLDKINSTDIIPCSKVVLEDCAAWVFFLRDPIERLVSAFYTSHDGGKHFDCKPGTKEFDIVQKAPSNISAFFDIPFGKRRRNCNIFNMHAKFLASSKKTLSKKEYLMLARTRLLQMDWFGLMSRFEESMAMLSNMFNIDLLHYRLLYTYNPHKTTITEEIKEKMAEGQEIDILLYRLAERVFDYRWNVLEKKIGKRINSQIFKCDTQITCFSYVEDYQWDGRNDPPQEYLALPRSIQRMSICSAPNGCGREKVW